MSAIEITCPHCSAKALVFPDDLGHDIDCPKCDESFEAPRMAKRSRVVGNGQSEDAEPVVKDEEPPMRWLIRLPEDEREKEMSRFRKESVLRREAEERFQAQFKKGADGWSLYDRVEVLSGYLGGKDAMQSAALLLKEYILGLEGDVPAGLETLIPALTLRDDPAFYSQTGSMPRVPRGSCYLLWRGLEVVKIDFDCEYREDRIQTNPSRLVDDWEDATDPESSTGRTTSTSRDAASPLDSEQGPNPDRLYASDDPSFVLSRVRKNGRATPVADSTSKRPVEGLDDVLRKQKARGPKKDEWADFEEPTHGLKMTCWRCGYHGRAPEQKRSAGDALLGFRVPVCPRCMAVNPQPLRILTRICYYPGFVILFFSGLSKLFSAFRYHHYDSTGAMTLGGLTAAAILLFLSFACVNALAKDKSIRSAKKK